MTIRFLAAAVCAAIAMPATAHHGWSSYDPTKTLQVDGALRDLQWGSPHGTAKVMYKGKLWDVILAPVSRMEARGLTAEMVGPGKKVRLVGYPRLDGTAEMRIERVIVGKQTVELR